MPRRKSARYDGIVRPHRHGNRWRYRVRDPRAGTYVSRLFAPGPEDAGRDRDGTAAGDRWANEVKAAALLGQSVVVAGAPDLPTLPVVNRYVEDLTQARRNEHHVAEVGRVLRSFATNVPNLLAAAVPDLVRKWRRNLRCLTTNVADGNGKGRRRREEAAPLAPVTINRYLGHVSALLQYAVDDGLLPRNPAASALKPVNVPDEVRPIFTVAEVRSILALDRMDDPIWRWAVLRVYTGMRSEEAMALHWENWNRSARIIEVRRHKGFKLKREKERNVPLQAELDAELATWPRTGATVVGLSAEDVPDRKRITVLFAQLLKEAGVEKKDRVPYSLRHCFAAMLLATREDVIRLRRTLGHSDLKLTDHYSREMDVVRAAVEGEGWRPGELRLRAHAGEPGSPGGHAQVVQPNEDDPLPVT